MSTPVIISVMLSMYICTEMLSTINVTCNMFTKEAGISYEPKHRKLYLLIDGLVQEIRNSSALAIELRLSCTNRSLWLRCCQICYLSPVNCLKVHATDTIHQNIYQILCQNICICMSMNALKHKNKYIKQFLYVLVLVWLSNSLTKNPGCVLLITSPEVSRGFG